MTAGRQSLLRDVTVVVVISVVTLGLQHAGLLYRFETAGLDAFNILKPARDATDLVVVGISEDDYADPLLFRSTSPLDCAALRRILDAIATGRPRVIGVDLDTSSGDFSCLSNATGKSPWPPVVWVQDAIWEPGARQFTPQPVRRGTTSAPGPADATGLATFPQEPDGVIRLYHRELPVAGGGYVSSFPWAVVETACSAACRTCCGAVEEYRVKRDRHEAPFPLRLNFAGERFPFTPLSVGVVLEAAKGEPSGGGWSERGPLTNRIVLLGGNYRAARDSHVTPIGSVSGVQIMAQAILSELGGGGIHTLHEGIAFTLDVALGLLLVGVHRRLHDRVGLALLISLGLFPMLCLIASYVAFSTFSLWFNFAVVVTSVLIDQLYRRVIENQRRAVHA